MRALLFTGGMDSTALAWMLRPEKLIFFDYGQKPAKGEERAARAIASAIRLELSIRRADLSAFGRGTMSAAGAAPHAGLEAPEFWPFRNQMLVTLAAMAFAGDPLEEILVGTVLGDDVHPDGRKEFVDSIDHLVKQQSGVRVVAPAINLTTRELVDRSGVPRSVLGWTFSCHTGEWACGDCRGCNKHREVIDGLVRTASIGSEF